MIFYRDTGRFIAKMNVVALEKRGEIRYMWLAQKTKAQRNQRREAFRVPVRMNVKVCEYTEEGKVEGGSPEEVKIVPELDSVDSRDISATGIAIMTKKEYNADEKFLLKLGFTDDKGKTQEFPVNAKVMRVTPWRDTKLYNVGLQFFGMPKNMNEKLSRHVLVEQQKDIKRKRR